MLLLQMSLDPSQPYMDGRLRDVLRGMMLAVVVVLRAFIAPFTQLDSPTLLSACPSAVRAWCHRCAALESYSRHRRRRRATTSLARRQEV